MLGRPKRVLMPQMSPSLKFLIVWNVPHMAPQASPPQEEIRCPTLHVGLGFLEHVILDLRVKAAGVAWGRGAKLAPLY